MEVSEWRYTDPVPGLWNQGRHINRLIAPGVRLPLVEVPDCEYIVLVSGLWNKDMHANRGIPP